MVVSRLSHFKILGLVALFALTACSGSELSSSESETSGSESNTVQAEAVADAAAIEAEVEGSTAEQPLSAEEISSKIIAKLQQARPDFAYGKAMPSPIPGLYQVQVINGPLLYVSEDGDFALNGTMYGVVKGGFVDLRELALKPARAQMMESAPLEDMIVFSPEGETKASVYVFTDVDCGYCRKLHQEVPELNEMGIEVRYLAFPRAGIGSASYRKIASAWCADDRNDALTRLKRRQSISAAYCDENPVADQYTLGNELGVRGTPAIILADGTLLPGYMPAKQLASQLDI